MSTASVLPSTHPAVAEPTVMVPRRWVLWIFLASIGMWAGFFGPIQVLLAQQAAVISPDHKESALALVTGVGAAVSMVLNPVWGAFSDRTTLAMGRRLPWVMGGVVGGAVAMLLLSQADTLWMLVLSWALAQGALNALLAALTATVPDQVPSARRGGVGAWLAIAQTVGVVLGAGIAAATGSIATGYFALMAVLVLTALPYLLDARDISLPKELREPFDWSRFLRGFWVSPRLHPDFGWAWITRFLMNLGNALLLLYLLYYLTDAVGLSDDDAANAVFT